MTACCQLEAGAPGGLADGGGHGRSNERSVGGWLDVGLGSCKVRSPGVQSKLGDGPSSKG